MSGLRDDYADTLRSIHNVLRAVEVSELDARSDMLEQSRDMAVAARRLCDIAVERLDCIVAELDFHTGRTGTGPEKDKD